MGIPQWLFTGFIIFLYNYEEVYKPSEFCIVGSSDMLLNYISSGLPELDVNHVRQMRMDVFLPYLMEKSWKKKFSIIEEDTKACKKSRLDFVYALECFLKKWIEKHLNLQDIRDRELGVILSQENMQDTRSRNPDLSLFQLEKLLNQRTRQRIQFLCTEKEEGFRKEKQKAYRNYFCSSKNKWTEIQIYRTFLEELEQAGDETHKFEGGYKETIAHVEKGQMDLYDTAALCLIRKRIFLKKETDEFSQIILDEAQDFGETVYYASSGASPLLFYHYGRRISEYSV